MAILATGDARFSASNLVIDRLAEPDQPRIDLYKRTHGKLVNLVRLQDRARHVFVQCDLEDRGLVDRRLAEHHPRAGFSFGAQISKTGTFKTVQSPLRHPEWVQRVHGGAYREPASRRANATVTR